jgi:hypothetical protein
MQGICTAHRCSRRCATQLVQLAVPKLGKRASLLVAIRVRPILQFERDRTPGSTDILRVVDDRVVLVLDPEPNDKDYLDVVQHRSKEKQYTFDVAFPAAATNADVYLHTIQPLVKKSFDGINCTVFAYGATGSGKTFTMVGERSDPGLMVRSIEDLFAERERFKRNEDVILSASYLEVYNEASICYKVALGSSSGQHAVYIDTRPCSRCAIAKGDLQAFLLTHINQVGSGNFASKTAPRHPWAMVPCR